MDKKIVFFDIDGTLWDRNNYIPESTKKAIALLKARGHKAFICTGRTKAYICNPELLSMDFDGIVSGCGTMIEIDGSIRYSSMLAHDLIDSTLKVLRKYRFKPILEGKEFLFMDYEDFGEDPYGKKLYREMGDRALPIKDNESKWECFKISCDMVDGDIESCFDALKDSFDYLVHNNRVVEMVPKGFNKGTGLLKACEMVGIDAKDSIAIGDGANDVDMFNVAGLSIAMGNGADVAKDKADYVTANLTDDGIYKALVHFNLL